MTSTYSHGLEKIYSFEVVNPQTVRAISKKEAARPEETPLLQKLLSAIDPKERYHFLQPLHLDHLFPLKVIELNEAKKWAEDVSARASKKVRESLQKEKNTLQDTWKGILDTTILPWLEARGGFAQKFELEECLSLFDKQAFYFSKIFGQIFELRSAFEHGLIPIEQEIFALDDFRKREYLSIINRAHSYFYEPFSAYSLDVLMGYLMRDFAKEWMQFDESTMRKVLLISPSFVRFRDSAGIIFLQKAP